MRSGRSLIDAVAAALESDYEERTAGLRAEYATEVKARMRDFPAGLLEDSESFIDTRGRTGPASLVPTYRRLVGPTFKIFPLGDYRRVWLPPMTGYTTLYISEDRRLYEYGPTRLREPYGDDDVAERISANLTELRQVTVDDLDLADLLACRELLDTVWVV